VLRPRLLEPQLHGGTVQHVALVRGAHHQAVHLHGSCLPDAVRARESLRVV